MEPDRKEWEEKEKILTFREKELELKEKELLIKEKELEQRQKELDWQEQQIKKENNSKKSRDKQKKVLDQPISYVHVIQDRDDKEIHHLEKTREDIRNEIKNRIEQRDSLSNQLIATMGVVAGFAVPNEEYRIIILLIPLLSIYYTLQILYSFTVHDFLTKYLRDVIEPRLSQLCCTQDEFQFSNYFNKNAKKVLKRSFYIYGMWVVSFFSMAYLWVFEYDNHPKLLTISTIIYVLSILKITRMFIDDSEKRL
ncbi:hypothetical protein [Thermoflavimicrobium dichotomicum]|uniref:Uncharacterized protein n=1 Tax=Thermoflavimicrobium dichotomicum TaxID=46223 RepID=A0A1I3LZM8_9BACL|nr:hypothetical protein [Thermoflavimicrobium dichotomicum]SFI89896.1 hypothetical protein SAMN05421852_102377 [Thermoflavimicrobium dichotomicum]